MPTFPRRRMPAAVAALAIVASLSFSAPAYADEVEPADLGQTPAVVVPAPDETDPTDLDPAESETTEAESTETEAQTESEEETPDTAPAARFAAAPPVPTFSLSTEPAVEPLTCAPTTAITSLSALDLSSSSTDGSSTTVLETGGLHVKTADTGHRKAAGYIVGTGWQPLDSVTDFVLTWTGTTAQPGGQLPVDLDGDDVADGILVIEPVNGGIQWLSVPGGGTWVSIPGAPHAAGGGAYPNQGTFAQWIAAYPDAQWTTPGYSLGSGVTGDGVISAITVVGSSNCSYTFGLPPVAAVACVATPLWGASDVNDVPPVVTASGLSFVGQAKAVNYYQRVSQGNAQGISDLRVTIDGATGPYSVQVKVEIYRDGGTSGYTTLSSMIPTGTTGVVNPMDWPWYSSRTTSGPGSITQPLAWADLIALWPSNVLASAPSVAMQTNGTGSTALVSKVSSSCGTTTFPQTVAPVQCVAAAGWATEDVAPQVTANGLVFRGQLASVNYYQRPATVSNAQGITGMSYTIAPGASGYGVHLKVEVDPNANLGTGGVIHYATLSTIQVPSVTPLQGTINAQSSLWYTTKIAYSSPGGMGNPLPWAKLIALMPNNTLLSTPSVHLQSGASEADFGVVTSVTSSCGTTSFVTPVAPPTSTPTDPGTTTGGTTTTTTTAATTTTPTSTLTPAPTGSPSATPTPAPTAEEELPTEAFESDATSGEGAPWWPWVLGLAILLLLALLWFLLLRRRSGQA
ncbi:MAG: hypothetical protein J0J03_08155 [Leifsonia sp.]|nr:hypothetical protein [Leifsonia sp.]